MATETIDLTPTWVGLLPALLAVHESGESSESRNTVRAELVRMAAAADLANELVAVLRHTAAKLEATLPMLDEGSRNTVGHTLLAARAVLAKVGA
jgi:hypothetical protein